MLACDALDACVLVMATSEKWYFKKEQLYNTCSRRCGIDFDKELSYRQQAANLIQDMGQRLQVTQLCINTAIVYMHRFYMFHSFARFHRNSIAACALFLAAKVEEQPRKLEHVIKVEHVCLHRDLPSPEVKSEEYQHQAHELVVNENIMLQTLGFDIEIEHPHKFVVKCCQLVRGTGKASKDLAQTSYFMATNSLHLTTMCLQYKPTIVACVCIHLACKWSKWEIPKSSEGKDWFFYVDSTATLEMLEELTSEFLAILDKCPSRLKRKILSGNNATSGTLPNPINSISPHVPIKDEKKISPVKSESKKSALGKMLVTSSSVASTSELTAASVNMAIQHRTPVSPHKRTRMDQVSHSASAFKSNQINFTGGELYGYNCIQEQEDGELDSVTPHIPVKLEENMVLSEKPDFKPKSTSLMSSFTSLAELKVPTNTSNADHQKISPPPPPLPTKVKTELRSLPMHNDVNCLGGDTLVSTNNSQEQEEGEINSPAKHKKEKSSKHDKHKNKHKHKSKKEHKEKSKGKDREKKDKEKEENSQKLKLTVSLPKDKTLDNGSPSKSPIKLKISKRHISVDEQNEKSNEKSSPGLKIVINKERLSRDSSLPGGNDIKQTKKRKPSPHELPPSSYKEKVPKLENDVNKKHFVTHFGQPAIDIAVQPNASNLIRNQRYPKQPQAPI